MRAPGGSEEAACALAAECGELLSDAQAFQDSEGWAELLA